MTGLILTGLAGGLLTAALLAALDRYLRGR